MMHPLIASEYLRVEAGEFGEGEFEEVGTNVGERFAECEETRQIAFMRLEAVQFVWVVLLQAVQNELLVKNVREKALEAFCTLRVGVRIAEGFAKQVVGHLGGHLAPSLVQPDELLQLESVM